MTKISDCASDGLFYSGFDDAALPYDSDQWNRKTFGTGDLLYFLHLRLSSMLPDFLSVMTVYLTAYCFHTLEMYKLPLI